MFHFELDRTIKNRDLTAWSFYNPKNPAEIVDIIITQDLAKLRMKKIRSGSRELPVLSVSDLIAMKKISGRPQDLEDVRALKELKK